MKSEAKLLLITFALGALGQTLTENFYATGNCSGSPTSSYQHSAGVCNLGGLVYQCATNKRCLQIRVYGPQSKETIPRASDDSSSSSSSSISGGCSGTLISTEAMPCDECTGGSDTTASRVVKGCGTSHPTINTCFGSGDCSSGCQSDGGNLTVGCYAHANGTAVDVRIIDCSAVIVQDYQDYNSCSGSILSQSVFAAGVCTAGMQWNC